MELGKSLVTAGFAAAAFVALSVGSASAVTFDVVGMNSSNTTATVDFLYDSTLGKITIDILNTASVSPDPRITGFVFNAPTNVTGISAFTASGTQDDTDWAANFDPNAINTPGNYGKFDVGGLTGSNVNGGTPASGIAKNHTGTFMFTLSGTGLGSLTEQSFLSLLSNPQNNNTEPQYFAVRFQRLRDGDFTNDLAIPTSPVPLPASLPLLFGALAGLGFISRRRNA